MRTLKKTIALGTIVAAAVGGYQGYKAYNKPIEGSMFMQNVEALSDVESGTEDDNYGYYWLHIKCFDVYGNENGKCTASSWEGTAQYHGNHTCSHRHDCLSCCN